MEGGGGFQRDLTNGTPIHRVGKPDTKQPWEILQIPMLHQGKVLGQEWKNH